MIQTASDACIAWGGSTTKPVLISHRENAVFRVTLQNHQQAALRLHRPGYNSVAEIRSELWWTDKLAKAGFSAPGPLKTTDGEYVLELKDGQLATMIAWVNGNQIGASLAPLNGTKSDQVKLYQNVGTLLARLHSISDELRLPDNFTRRDWNCGGFLGPDPLWGRFWENPALDNDAQTIICQARTKACGDLENYTKDGADHGLIHADALRENIFQDGNELTLIDFDDSGFGFRLYDLTTALSQSSEEPYFEHLKGAVFDGYARIRPVRQNDIDQFELLSLLRRFASLGWIVPRHSPDDPDVAIYVDRALQASQAYLK